MPLCCDGEGASVFALVDLIFKARVGGFLSVFLPILPPRAKGSSRERPLGHGNRRGETYHPDHPLDRLPVLITVVWERDLVVLVVLLAEVQLDAGALEDALGLARGLVDDGWDTAVG